MNEATPILRVHGSASGWRVQQQEGGKWVTLSERYTSAAEARAAINRMGGDRR